MAHGLVLIAAACAGYSAGAVEAAAVAPADEWCGSWDDAEPSALLQTSRERAAIAGHFHCPRRSLVIGLEVGVTTYLQWNGALRRSGADFIEFLNTTRAPGEVRFDGDVDFVKCSRPVFGIVYVRLQAQRDLAREDALKLREYLDAGGMLVIGETNPGQVNQLMMDLGSSIRQRRGGFGLACTPPETTPYAPNVHSLTKGVTGLQGSRLDLVVDELDSSYPLFHIASNTSLVVARVEKRRNLVVVGDDEPFNDNCVNNRNREQQDNRFAFSETTNLRFFANLWKERCPDER